MAKKRMHKETEQQETQQQDDVKIDMSGVKRLLSKLDVEMVIVTVFVLSCMLLVLYIRLLPAALPTTDDWAANTIQQNVRSQVAAQVDAEFPALPQTNRDALVTKRTNDLIAANAAQFETTKQQISQQFKSYLRYTGDDGKEYTYLGDLDSYFWLRYTRNYLKSGVVCDTIQDGKCWDNHILAPYGAQSSYDPSLHVFAIAWLYRIITPFHPNFPLPATSYLIPVIIGMLGVIPAFFIGRRLAGNVGGLFAAILISLHPLFLSRSMGSDNDIWNIVIPLFIIWIIIEAYEAKSAKNQMLFAALAALFVGLHAAAWDSWWFSYLIILFALVGLLGFRLLTFVSDGKSRVPLAAAVLAWYILAILGLALGGLQGGALALLALAGSGLFLLGILIYAGMRIVQSFLGKHKVKPWMDLRLRAAAIIPCVYYAASFVFVSIVKLASGTFSASAYFLTPVSAFAQGQVLDRAISDNYWPNVLTTVAELNKSSFAEAVGSMGGNIFFFGCMLGLLLLVLPRNAWNWKHYSIATVGGLISLYLLNSTSFGRFGVIGLLGLSILVILLLYLFEEENADIPAALIVLAWFMATMYATYSGVRFILLMIPAYGIGFAVFAGRIYEWATGLLHKETGWHRYLINTIAFLLIILLLIQPVRSGYDTARTFIPSIDDSWWDTLTKINKESAPNAIINSWWDFGHWFKYIADRRVTADGVTQNTHVPRWLGLALVTPDEHQSIGTLRMLTCGSDIYPHEQGKYGAYGRILAIKGDPLVAQQMVVDLTDMQNKDEATNKRNARTYLIEHGITGATDQDAILNVTHCDPPQDFFITSGDMVGKAGVWAHFGLWNFTRAYIADKSRNSPATDRQSVIGDFETRFNLTKDEAESLYYDARSLSNEGDINAFAAPWPGYITGSWMSCQETNNGSAVTCPIGLRVGQQGGAVTAIESFVYNTSSPNASRLVFGVYQNSQRVGGVANATPSEIVLAKADTMEKIGFANPTSPIAVLYDVPNKRVLLTDPLLATSMFTQLFYLDGRYSKHFVKFDDQTGFSGTRVITWTIDWNGTDTASASAGSSASITSKIGATTG